MRTFLRNYFETFCLALILGLFIRFFVLSSYRIPSESMYPSLWMGDFVFAFRLPFGVQLPGTDLKLGSLKDPRRGEVIVFRHPQETSQIFIKRVVGISGDRIEIKKGELWINGQKAEYETVNPDPRWVEEGPRKGAFAKETILGNERVIYQEQSDEAQFFGPVVVAPEQVFVLGDHRVKSDDSRQWGGVPLRLIDAKAWRTWFSIHWSLEDSPTTIRWWRILRSVP